MTINIKRVVETVSTSFTLAAAAVFSAPAFAGIVSVSGDLNAISTPASLIYSSSSSVSGSPSLAGAGPVIFSEFSAREIPDFSVDLGPVAYSGFRFDGFSTAGYFDFEPTDTFLLPTGRVVDSFVIHFDPAEYSGTYIHTKTGSVTFDRPLLAVQIHFDDRKERVLDLPGIQFAGSSGLEIGSGGPVDDQLSISNDFKTLSFAFSTSGATEDVRIFFNTVPEPSTLALVGIAVLGVTVRRKQRETTP